MIFEYKRDDRDICRLYRSLELNKQNWRFGMKSF